MNSHKRTASYSELRFLAKQEGLGWFSSRFWALIGVLGSTQIVTLSDVDNDEASATLHPVEAKKEIEMNKPHKHAALIKQWADDTSQTVWFWDTQAREWVECRPSPVWYEGKHYAIGPKPTEPLRKMCVLAGVEFPAPETVAPAHRTTYYFPAISSDYPVGSSEWICGDGWGSQRYQLENGFIHLTREAAEQHARALLAVNKQAIERALCELPGY